MPEIERVDVPVRGGSLATFRLSSGERPVLAVHGITATSRSWLAVARALDGSASVIAPDLRGRGRSNELGPPFGMGAHADDVLAVLDHFGIDRAVLVGHSMGGYVVARLAADHPDRVHTAILIDGGLTIPTDPSVDPQAFADAFLGPAIARLKMTFPDRGAYRAWWRRHPALQGDEVSDDDLNAYADYDLIGEEPSMHSSVAEAAVRGDAAELFEMGAAAHRLAVPAKLLCAPRGLLNDPNPMQPLALVEQWAAGAPGQRQAVPIPDCNHYTITMGAPGARAVADIIRTSL